MSRYSARVECLTKIIIQFSIQIASLSTPFKKNISQIQRAPIAYQSASRRNNYTVMLAYVYTLERTHFYIPMVYKLKSIPTILTFLVIIDVTGLKERFSEISQNL